MHRAIIENAHNMPTLAKTAAKVGDQYLPDSRLVTEKLHQLIDTTLLRQVSRALLLERQPGTEGYQSRAFISFNFSFSRQPATILHGIKQRTHVATRAARQTRQLVERHVLYLTVTVLPQMDELLLQTTRRHKRGTSAENSAVL